MTEAGGGNMNKPRSQSLSQPYSRNERRKSLFGKVKDSVKDILSPSWLSDLVSSVRKESPAKQTEDTEQEVFMSPIQAPPIPTQQNYARSGPVLGTPNSYLGDRGNGQPRSLEFSQAVAQGPTLLPNAVPPISEFTSSQLPLTRLTEKSDSVMANEDNQSQRSDNSKSTSGCSSMVPHPEKRDYQAEEGDQRQERMTGTKKNPRDDDPDIATPAAKRAKVQEHGHSFSWASKYTPSLSKQQTPVAAHKPSFNSSLFGSSVLDTSNTSLLGTSFHDSSFYPGKTTYGGRSSVRRKADNLNKSMPAKLPFPVRTFIKPKKANANVSAVTSSTARRIMETLDKMSSPVRDARKFPVLPSNWSQNKSFSGRSQTSISSGPPKQRLNVSALASISTNRQRVSFQPPVPSTSGQVNTSGKWPSSQPDNSRSRLVSQDTEILSAGSGKMKRDKSYHKGSSAAKTSLQEEETVEVPDLRTEYTLPVSHMPKISFSGPTETHKPQKATMSKDSPSGRGFSFSSPIQEKPLMTGKAKDNQMNFKFSSPITVDKKKIDFNFETVSASSSIPMSTPSFSTAPKPKQQSQGNGIVSQSNGSGFQPASQLKQGSVMDILGGGGGGGGGFKPATTLKQGSVMDVFGAGATKAATTAQPEKASPTSSGGSSNDLMAKLKPASGSWTCDVCLLSNKPQDDKCVACQSSKPVAKQPAASLKDPAPQSTAPGSNLFDKFKPAAGTWSCVACLIENKADDKKCVACQTEKPSEKPQGELKYMMPPGNWICSVCLIQNKASDSMCKACSAKKSDTSQTASRSTDKKTESGSSTSGAVGKSWSCETCLVPNKAEDAACVCCQTPKPVTPFKYPEGEWVCDTCLVKNKEGTFKCIACEYARPGPPRDKTVPSCATKFSTNFSALSSSKALGGFNLPASTESNSMPITFGGKNVNTESTSALTSFKFGSSDSSKKETSLPAGFKFGSSDSTVNESTVSGGFKFGSSASDTKATTGFQFGGTTINTDKPEQNFIFGEKSASSSSSTSQTVVREADSKAQSDKPAVESDPQTKVSVSASSAVSCASTVSSVPGGFIFGQKPEQTNSSSVSGGFSVNFGSGGSNSVQATVKSTASSLSNSTSLPASVGGFNFQSTVQNTTNLTSNSTTGNSQDSSKLGGFNFSASKTATPIMSTGGSITQSSANAEAAKPAENKPAFGGFNMTQPSSGFNFGQKPEENKSAESKPFVFGATPTATNSSNLGAFGSTPSSTSSSVSSGGFNFQPAQANTAAVPKRTREDDSGETGAKKLAVNFAAGPSSSMNTGTPFQFTGANSTSQTSGSTAPTLPTAGVFTFGQQNNTSTGTGKSAAIPAFNFSGQSSKPVSNATPLFGGVGSNTGIQNQSNSTSAFGGTSQFSFTANKPATTSASATTGFNFGAQNNTGASAFGSGFGSTASGFGSSTPAFGGAGTAPVTSTPAFGSGGAFNNNFKFGEASKPADAPQAPAPASIFQFGAKPAVDAGNTATPQPAAPTASPAVGFNFGQQGQTPNFNFTSTAAPSSFAFSAAPTGGDVSGRKIKKAVRKIRR